MHTSQLRIPRDREYIVDSLLHPDAPQGRWSSGAPTKTEAGYDLTTSTNSVYVVAGTRQSFWKHLTSTNGKGKGLTSPEVSKLIHKYATFGNISRVQPTNIWVKVETAMGWVYLANTRYAGKTTVEVQQHFSTETKQITTLKARLTATGGASYGPFSLQLQAELEKQLTSEWTGSESRTTTQTVEIPGAGYRYDFVLARAVRLTFPAAGTDVAALQDAEETTKPTHEGEKPEEKAERPPAIQPHFIYDHGDAKRTTFKFPEFKEHYFYVTAAGDDFDPT